MLLLCCALPVMHGTPSVLTPHVYAVPPRSLLDIVGAWLYWAGTLLFVGIPIWIAQGLTALLAVTVGYVDAVSAQQHHFASAQWRLCLSTPVSAARNKTFFASKDRSTMKYQDPFPVEHSFIEVNGIK